LEDNIKINHLEIEDEAVKYTKIAQNMLMKLRVMKAELISW
jgi:hypothetical protein